MIYIFGIFLTLIIFYFSTHFLKKIKIPFFNPLLLSIVIIVLILILFNIKYEEFNKGGSYITFFISPATVALGLPLYKNLNLLKKHLKLIIFSIITTSIIICFIILMLSKLTNVNYELTASLMPKSITTAIGVEVAKNLGGIEPITVISIIITGNLGMIVADYIFKIFKINNPISQGISLGLSSHAIGTVKSFQLGEIQGAMSSIAMCLTGITVVFIAPIMMYLYKVI